MIFQTVQLHDGGFTIIAESPEEKAMLNTAVAMLESVFPNGADRVRPTAHLLLLEVLQTQSFHANIAKT